MLNLISSATPSVMEIITSILLLLSGLGVFLFGLKAMGDNLENIAGPKMRKVFDKISNNRFIGMGVGAGVTAVIQSSSATTVMVVGFVNAGVMTLMQAAPIIMGANIGTTITAQIVSLQSLNITAWLACLTCIGAFMMMSKKNFLKQFGAILAGLGLIFVGLDVMSNAMEVFSAMPAVKQAFAVTTNPFLLVFIGLAFTALIQSSSATTSILVAMAGAGIIGLQSSMFIILGCNMGTCITAALAAIGACTNAKRAAMIHFMFNFMGAIIFLPICWFAKLDKGLAFLFKNNVVSQIAMFHTLFNVSTTIVLIWFVKPMVLLAEKILPNKKKKGTAANTGEYAFVEDRLNFIDYRLLSTPVIAITNTKKEILLMADLARANFNLSVDSVMQGKVIDKHKFEMYERHLNFMNREISKFLVSISSAQVSFKDELQVASFYHVVSDIERIGDYSENIVEYTEELDKTNTKFSEQAIAEIKDMADKVIAVHDSAIRVFNEKDLALLPEVHANENKVDACKSKLNIEHIKRLNSNQCTPAAGALFLSLISNMERIADHMENIAVSIKDYTSKPKKVLPAIAPKDISHDSNFSAK